MNEFTGTCVALSGGVGGAKLALGLSRILAPAQLDVIVNTGDDFEHLGLTICPDLDTLTYTLAGLNNTETGWGRAGETWTFMASLRALGGESWFQLGDGDLAIHVERTRRLAAGEPLSRVTAELTARLEIELSVIPMSDDPVRTFVETAAGALAFQHYFVRDQCAPEVTGFEFRGAKTATPSPMALGALADPALDAVVICPSNPFISIDPILAVPGLRGAIEDAAAPVIAVSPIVGGKAIKGPTAKMMVELGVTQSAASVARHYDGLIDGFVLDSEDAASGDEIRALGLDVLTTNTVMQSLEDRVSLAADVLEFATKLRSKSK
ncbi:MAG: 2-phospho-L-lactate transferase [Alphaproteobacteria bacterium]|nr:2-phospho-L-lactate transferase [Alphaproteobacteria bacterium]